MMENHSFDHMLGFVPGIGDLDGSQYNCDQEGSKINVSSGAEGSQNGIFDPNHATDDVLDQMYGTSQISPTTGDPTGDWFVKNNFPSASPTDEMSFMQSYSSRSSRGDDKSPIPRLIELATTYVTCDRWFSSVLGPTGPNRLFLHCASSGGYYGGAYEARSYDRPVKLPSIFQSMDDSLPITSGTPNWGIYTDDPKPPFLAESETLCTAFALQYVQGHDDQVFELAQFCSDVGTSQQPRYSFIVPKLKYTSQHPTGCSREHDCCNDASIGDRFIGTIYDTIRGNKTAWGNTLLVVTYDEHGGYYDSIMPTGHVEAPTVSEGERVGVGTRYCDPGATLFTRLGVRIPTILVSSRTSHAADSTIYETASIPATIKKKFGLSNFLSERDANANTFI
jgi:phospholipase C